MYHIIQRDCPRCDKSHRMIYYRRFTDVHTFDIYSYLKDWRSDHNELNIDFALYSSLEDAIRDSGRWEYCNFDKKDIGAFRECGESKKKKHQYVSNKKTMKKARFSIYSCTNQCGTGCVCTGNGCYLNDGDDCNAMDPVPELGSLEAAAPTFASYEVPDGSNSLRVHWESTAKKSGIECEDISDALATMLERGFYIFKVKAERNVFIRMSFYPSFQEGTVPFSMFHFPCCLRHNACCKLHFCKIKKQNRQHDFGGSKTTKSISVYYAR